MTAQLAAQRPDHTIAALLIDAIVGDQWDLMVNLFRVNPFLLMPLGVGLAVDAVATLPLLDDPRQAAKLGRLLAPTLIGHATRPWRLVGPAASILRTKGSRGILDELALDEVPTFVIHGDRDLIVPFATARVGGQAGQRHPGHGAQGRPLVAARATPRRCRPSWPSCCGAGWATPSARASARPAPSPATSSRRSSTSPTRRSSSSPPSRWATDPAPGPPPAPVPLDHHLTLAMGTSLSRCGSACHVTRSTAPGSPVTAVTGLASPAVAGSARSGRWAVGRSGVGLPGSGSGLLP